MHAFCRTVQNSTYLAEVVAQALADGLDEGLLQRPDYVEVRVARRLRALAAYMA
jgi:hypothetical protein